MWSAHNLPGNSELALDWSDAIAAQWETARAQLLAAERRNLESLGLEWDAECEAEYMPSDERIERRAYWLAQQEEV